MSTPLPLVPLSTVYHSGTLDRRLSQTQHLSHEGHHLSVTTEPAAWQRIARLSGPTWTLTRPGGVFIDEATVDRTPTLKAALLSDAQRAGLLIQEAAFEVWVDDPETGVRFCYVRTWDEAVNEVICDHPDTCDALIDRLERRPHATYDECRALLPRVNGHPAAQPVTRHVGTPKLLEEHGLHAEFTLTGALAHAARQAGLDGVWKDRPISTHDAPRGLILDERVRDWHALDSALRRTS